MHNRRNFLKTGIVFCGCCLLDQAQAQQGPRKLPVMVSGKRVKTIDVHSHCHFREAGALLGAEAQAIQVPTVVNGARKPSSRSTSGWPPWTPRQVDMEVLSINPFWYGRDRDLAAQIVKIQNEKLAGAVRQQAGPVRRLRLAHPAGARPRGAGARDRGQEAGPQGRRDRRHGDGVEFSDPKFHPVWAKAEELGVPLFIHPQGVAELGKRLSGNGWLGNTIGNPLETTIALSHLIFEGTLDKFPGLKVIAAHGGGLPAVLCRPLRPCLHGRAERLQRRHQAQEEAERVPQAALLRFADLLARGDPPSGGAGRRRPGRAGAATIPIPGSSSRSTTSSPAARSATTRRPTSSAIPRPSS
jgi:aminocarboxymuconate-semialdehyde decarboxylase